MKDKSVGGVIWAEGVHHMKVGGEPKTVKVNRTGLERTFEKLKDNLPIPLGIDHLSDDILRSNQILRKLNLLDVGLIRDVELGEDGIRIVDAEITNPQVLELHAKGELPSFSVVSDIYTRDCPELTVDYLEAYSNIKRVDFVEKGACDTCNVEAPMLVNAKAIIIENKGDDKVTDEKKKEGLAEDVSEKLDSILSRMDDIDGRLSELEGSEGEEEGEEDLEGEEGNPEGEVEGEAKSQDIRKLEKEIEDLKMAGLKAEAKAVVKGYLQAGKIAPKDVEKHEALAMKQPDDYKALMDDAPVIVDLEKHSKQDGEARDTGEEDESFKAYQKATGQDKKE